MNAFFITVSSQFSINYCESKYQGIYGLHWLRLLVGIKLNLVIHDFNNATMVSAMSYPRNPLWYDLCCIIWGDSSIHSFSVRVCKDSTISELKDMVKKSKLSLSLVHSDEIRLWKVDICLEDEKLLQQYCYAKEHDQGKKMLSSTNSVNDYWSEQPKDCHIQLIVEPTLIGRSVMRYVI